ncbi:putative Pre-mRNA-processing protein 45 [Seiridium unicorne]|uniref:Pre-mRNA-processing protein 45 n=1 Tax=Seiridium unicorne TaxID=138068 RepID=A0ABR2UYR0_9PEZI
MNCVKDSARLENKDLEASDSEIAKIQEAPRLSTVLGIGTLKGSAKAEPRPGPVQFEKDVADPFNIDGSLSGIGSNVPIKEDYGLQEDGSSEAKRLRVSEDED